MRPPAKIPEALPLDRQFAPGTVQRRVAESLEAVDTPDGRRRVAEYLKSQPFPHYEAAPGSPGWLVRIDAEGTRTLGRFVKRCFEPK